MAFIFRGEESDVEAPFRFLGDGKILVGKGLGLIAIVFDSFMVGVFFPKGCLEGVLVEDSAHKATDGVCGLEHIKNEAATVLDDLRMVDMRIE